MKTYPGWFAALGMMILTLGACASPEPGDLLWTDIPTVTSPTGEAPTPLPTPLDEERPPVDEPGPPPEVPEDVVISLMGVEQVEARVLGSAPAKVEVTVMGVLGDACTEFDSVEQAREGSTVTLTLWARRPADMVCAQIARVYERVVPLEGTFEAGEYRLVANEFETSFSVPGPGEGGEWVEGLAFVNAVDAMVMESYPAQVALVVRGWLPDSCTKLDEVRQERKGNEIEVTMTTRRPAEAFCTQAIVEFEERVKLEGGFEGGDYVVRVNDFEVKFHVD